jgi:hypothetical protein
LEVTKLTYRIIGLSSFRDFEQQNIYDILIMTTRSYDGMTFDRNGTSEEQYAIDHANFYRFVPSQMMRDHADEVNVTPEDERMQIDSEFSDAFQRLASRNPSHEQWLIDSYRGWIGELLF